MELIDVFVYKFHEGYLLAHWKIARRELVVFHIGSNIRFKIADQSYEVRFIEHQMIENTGVYMGVNYYVV